jgi:signal transduction histidine kinase
MSPAGKTRVAPASPRGFEREVRNFIIGGLLFLLFLAGVLLLAYRNLARFSEREVLERVDAVRPEADPFSEDPRISLLLRVAGARQAAIYDAEGRRQFVATFLPDASLAPAALLPGDLPDSTGVRAWLEAEGSAGPNVFVVLSSARGFMRTGFEGGAVHFIRRSSSVFSLVIPGASFVLVLLVVPFLRRLFRPIDALTETARDAGKVIPDLPADGSVRREDEAERAIATFARTVAELRRRSAELENLRRREKERADALQVTAETLVRSHPGGLLVVDSTGVLAQANVPALDMLALAKEAVSRRASEALVRFPALCHALEDAAGGRPTLASEFTLADSTWGRQIVLTAVPVVEQTNRYLGTLIFLEDRTATRRLERELSLKRELASLGEMSAGIAHEFRNSTATILGYAKLASQTKDPEALARYLEAIRKEGDHIARVTGDFLLFARPERMHPEPSELGSLIREVVDEQESHEGMITVEIPSTPLTLPLDAALLRRALVNLVKNALEAAGENPAGPKVLIRCVSRREAVEISVEDNGHGISKESHRKLFVPFFSTKETGTGLGLALVAKIAGLHGGSVSAESSAELGGARFVVKLPLEEPGD